MNVLVESTVKLSATELSAVQALLTKKIEGKFDIKNTVNEEILGGLRVTIGSKRIDVSLKGKLDQVKKLLV